MGVVHTRADIGAVLAFRVEVVLQRQRRRQQGDITQIDIAGRRVHGHHIVRGHAENEFERPVVLHEIGDVQFRHDRGVNIDIPTDRRDRRLFVRHDVDRAQAHQPVALFRHRRRGENESRGSAEKHPFHGSVLSSLKNMGTFWTR